MSHYIIKDSDSEGYPPTDDTDESYDADEYDEEAFDEGGNLVESSITNRTMKLRTHLGKVNFNDDSSDNV